MRPAVQRSKENVDIQQPSTVFSFCLHISYTLLVCTVVSVSCLCTRVEEFSHQHFNAKLFMYMTYCVAITSSRVAFEGRISARMRQDSDMSQFLCMITNATYVCGVQFMVPSAHLFCPCSLVLLCMLKSAAAPFNMK